MNQQNNSNDGITKKEIKITLGLDAQNMPVNIWWNSSDEKGSTPPEVKAMFLAMFDKDTKDTLKLDLWTRDFQVMEMDRFIYHTIRSLADTYIRATQNKEMANKMQQFAQHFGEETKILPKE